MKDPVAMFFLGMFLGGFIMALGLMSLGSLLYGY